MFLITWKSPESELRSRSFPRASAAPRRSSEGWELQLPRPRPRAPLLPGPSCQPLAPGTCSAKGLPVSAGQAAEQSTSSALVLPPAWLLLPHTAPTSWSCCSAAAAEVAAASVMPTALPQAKAGVGLGFPQPSSPAGDAADPEISPCRPLHRPGRVTPPQRNLARRTPGRAGLCFSLPSTTADLGEFCPGR